MILFHKTSPQSLLENPFQHASQIKIQVLQHLKVEMTVPDSQSTWLENHYIWVLIRRSLRWFSQLIHCQDSTCQLQEPDIILQHLESWAWWAEIGKAEIIQKHVKTFSRTLIPNFIMWCFHKGWWNFLNIRVPSSNDKAVCYPFIYSKSPKSRDNLLSCCSSYGPWIFFSFLLLLYKCKKESIKLMHWLKFWGDINSYRTLFLAHITKLHWSCDSTHSRKPVLGSIHHLPASQMVSLVCGPALN